MTNNKIERLKAIKEQFALAQTKLVAFQKLEESAQTAGMATLLENDLEQAELVLAAQDMMHKLQNMAEDLAKMNAQDLFPLVDKMKAAFGQDKAHDFEEHAQNVLSQAMQTVRSAKDEMGNAIMRLEGKMPANDMAADAQMDPSAHMSDQSTPNTTADIDAAMDDFGSDDDSFGGAEANSGPEEEPLGRAKKESREGGNALNESIILERAGNALILSEGLDSLIDWILTEAAAGMPEEHFRTFAKSVAQKAAKDPAKLAGWIGKKKHGMAAMAQMAEPTYTQGVDLEIVGEGKTYKANDSDDDNWKKKSYDKAKKSARKEKGDYSLDETVIIERSEIKPGYNFVNPQHQVEWGGYTFDSACHAIRDLYPNMLYTTIIATDKNNDAMKRWKTNIRTMQTVESIHSTDMDDNMSTVHEGKTFRRGEDADEDEGKKVKDVARKSARKQKGDDSLDEGKSFRRGEDADDYEDKKAKDIARKSARKQKGEDQVSESTFAARAIAQLIEQNIKNTGKGEAAKMVKEFAHKMTNNASLMEGIDDCEAWLLEAFQAEFGMKPASFSVSKARQMKEDAPLSPQDKEAAAAVAGKLAAASTTDKNAGNQPIQSAMNKLNPQERTVAQKMVNNAKQNGQNPQKASDLAAAAQVASGDDANNPDQPGVTETKGDNRQLQRRRDRKAINRSEDPSSQTKHGYGGVTAFASSKGEYVDENINAAHWPVDSMGQYKGEPMSTDYGKLKPVSGTPKAGKTETTSGSDSEVPETNKPASAKPWEKKEEPKEDTKTEEVSEGVTTTLKRSSSKR